MHVGSKIKEMIDNNSKLRAIPKKEIAKLIGTSENNLYELFKKESVETKYLVALSEISGESIYYFFDEQNLLQDNNTEYGKKNNSDFVNFLMKQNEKLMEINRTLSEKIKS